MNNNLTRTRESAIVSFFSVNNGHLEASTTVQGKASSVVAGQGKGESVVKTIVACQGEEDPVVKTVKSELLEKIFAGQGASVMAFSL